MLRAQRDLGVAVPDGVIEAYEAVVDDVDLASIGTRERVTRHDVKARIEEFSALAGHEHIHKGMTSRDLTENVEQLQVRASLALVRDRMVAALARLARLAAEHAGLVMVGRSHNVAAQATTLGKRFANVGRGAAARPRTRRGPAGALPAPGHQGAGGHGGRTSSTCSAIDEASSRRSRQPWRGTSGSSARSARSARCTRDRSTSTSCRRSSKRQPGRRQLATTMRLMAGHELVTEGSRRARWAPRRCPTR